jgi:hypothetical protein
MCPGDLHRLLAKEIKRLCEQQCIIMSNILKYLYYFVISPFGNKSITRPQIPTDLVPQTTVLELHCPITAKASAQVWLS